MKFSVDKDKLSHLLYITSTIVERKNTMPILANVKIDAYGDKLSISATDIEISVIGFTDAIVEEEGSFSVSAKVAYEIVKELPDEVVHAQFNNGQHLYVHCGQSKYKIVGTIVDEFPNISFDMKSDPLSIEAIKLYEMLDKTAYAVSTDDTRFNITGVFIETIDMLDKQSKGIRFVSTDGHRLAMVDRLADGINLSQGVIIPRKGIQELKKMLEGEQGQAIICFNEGTLIVNASNVTMGVRLIDGQFPDYRKVIPSNGTTVIKVDRDILQSSVKRIALVTTDKQRTLCFSIENGILNIYSSSPEYGEASDKIEVEQDGEDVKVGFSARYVGDILTAMSGEKIVSIILKNDSEPGIFKGDNDDGYCCVVMPMRFE